MNPRPALTTRPLPLRAAAVLAVLGLFQFGCSATSAPCTDAPCAEGQACVFLDGGARCVSECGGALKLCPAGTTCDECLQSGECPECRVCVPGCI